ncbi:ABC transporter substrate-binding protein [Desulfofundulus thermobenzoicus]|uniref:ABC transporter substrate-binding protein n=2 Tax=Desulfofundulus thermobenzoicus TaxID=29376 RepID=A0A6N7IT82_9FIRM|nr:ABC transporter substrate-binding protein [Desulfofundulus thermobenzoicus]
MKMRIVSLVPAHTEILFALGLGEQVVGVTAHCDYPPPVAAKDRVGFFNRPEPEKIMALRPDLVLAGGPIHHDCGEKLLQMGARVFHFAPRTVQELLQGMDDLAEITGAGEEGHRLVAGLKERVVLLRERVRDFPRPRVMFIMGEEPLVTPGPASIQYDALGMAGAALMPAGEDKSAIFLSRDDITGFDPEIILACGQNPFAPPRKRCPGCTLKNPPCMRDVEKIKNHPLLAGVAAVQEGMVFTIPCHWLCRPGPRLIEGMERISHLCQEFRGKPFGMK